MVTVALCEDDAALRDSLRRLLQAEGYDVWSAGTGGDLLRGLEGRSADVVVLDLGLPDADGRDVCLAMRARGVTVPVLMLTALDGVHNTVSGLHAGADDYLTKPFDGAELSARLSVLLRRAPVRAGVADEVVLDPAGHCIRRDEATEDLSPTEFRLLARLVGAPGEVIRRRGLIAAGWPMGAQVSENTLDSYLRRIRDKLDRIGAADRITTVRGVGYRWD